jgi:hypothetical protein
MRRDHPSAKEAAPMRSLIAIYLAFGLVLLIMGFYGTGDCPIKNKDVVSDALFVVGWPVYFYREVVRGPLTPVQFMHVQACHNGVVALSGALRP